MSDDLTKKLDELCIHHLYQSGEVQQHHLTEEDIETIKHAFIDAGWFKTPDVDGEPRKVTITYKENTDAKFAKLRDYTLMTGQEWYDRFEKELQEIETLPGIFTTHDSRVAAKKASGIE